MDYIKKATMQLKNHKETVQTTELLPMILKENKLEIYIVEKALACMDEQEKNILQRVCIDDVSPRELEKEFGISYRKIYKLREAALKKFARLAYGVKLWEGEKEQ